MPNFYIQDTVTSIGASAFSYCTSMNYFSLSVGVETIGTSAFNTNNVTLDIYIDQNVDNIVGAPWGNGNAWVIWNGLVVADKLDEEGEIEFQYLLELREDGSTANIKSMRDTEESTRYTHYIAHEVWDRNDRTKPYYITHIPDETFSTRNSISGLEIEEGIIYIGDKAFYAAYYLTNISLPAGLEYLGSSAFYLAGWYSSTIGTLTIGEGIDTILEGCFNSARYYQNVNLPHSILYVEKNAFGGTISSMLSLEFTNRVEFDESGTGTLPSSLTSLYLPAYSSEEEVPGLEAANLSKQTQMVYYGDTYEYVTDQGSIWFHADTETVFKYIGTSEVVDIPETIEIEGVEHTVSRIDDYFLQSSNRTITEIFVPSTVEYIGENAFYQSSTTLELIYINQPEDSLDGAPWGNTGKGLLILWNNSLKIGDYYYRIQEDGTINIIKYRGKATTLDVNEFNSLFEVDPEYVITKIEENTFYENTLLAHIILPESVDIIGDYAFAYCTALESIELPGEMAAYGLGDYVFNGCVKLKEIHLPSGIVNTGAGLGVNCTALELVTVPLDITEIGSNFVSGTPYTNKNMIVQFLGRLESNPIQSESWTSYRTSSGTPYTYYQGLILYEDRILRDGWVYSTSSNTILNYYIFTMDDSHIEFPASFVDDSGHTSYVKHIDGDVTGNGDTVNQRYPYNNIQYADSIVVPSGVETLGANIFKAVSASTIVVADTVTTIGDGGFRDCENLVNLTLTKNLDAVAGYLFRDSTAITHVELPTTVRSIGTYAFEGATALESIEIPYGTLSIGTYAFQGCTSLEHVNMANTVTTLGASAFSGCTNLESVNTSKNLVSVGSYAFKETVVEDLAFGDKLETISGLAFSEANQLRSVTIGADDSAISSMPVNTFVNTPALEFINIENTREGVGQGVYSLAPWGAADDVTVRYQGEFVKFEYYIEQLFPVYGEVKYMIYIWAYNEKNYIKEVHLPDQSYDVHLEGSYTWYSEEDPFIYEVNDYGVYQFTGIDNNESMSMWFNVFVEEMEIPLISTQNIEITPYQIETFDEAAVLKLAEANGWTYDGDDLEVQFYDGEYEKLEELENYGDEVILSMYVYDERYGTYAKKEILATLIDSQAPMVFAEDVEISHAELLALEYESELIDVSAYELMIEESEDTTTDPGLEAIKDIIIQYTNAYAINYDGSRDLPVDVAEEYLIEIYEQLLAAGSYFVTLTTFDDLEGLSDDVTVEITYAADIWSPVVMGDHMEIKLFQAENMDADTFLELSNANAWAGDGEELSAFISDANIDKIKAMNQIGQIEYVELITVDPRYVTSATCEVRVTIVDEYSPLISASNADLDYKYYEILRILDEDITKLLEQGGDISGAGIQESLGLTRKYIIALTKATATSYNKARTLEVEITDNELIEIYTNLVEEGSAEVTFTTYDEEEKKGASTTAILNYEEEKWYPTIVAYPKDLSNEEYNFLAELETTEEVKEYIIELTQAEAWNYDKSVKLDVEVDGGSIVNVATVLADSGSIVIKFSTTDPDQGTSADTQAKLSYTQPEPEPEPEPMEESMEEPMEESLEEPMEVPGEDIESGDTREGVMTGDENSVMVYIILLFLSVIGLRVNKAKRIYR